MDTLVPVAEMLQSLSSGCVSGPSQGILVQDLGGPERYSYLSEHVLRAMSQHPDLRATELALLEEGKAMLTEIGRLLPPLERILSSGHIDILKGGTCSCCNIVRGWLNRMRCYLCFDRERSVCLSTFSFFLPFFRFFLLAHNVRTREWNEARAMIVSCRVVSFHALPCMTHLYPLSGFRVHVSCSSLVRRVCACLVFMYVAWFNNLVPLVENVPEVGGEVKQQQEEGEKEEEEEEGGGSK